MEELQKILDELRDLIAANESEKDNVLLDLLDSVKTTIETIIENNKTLAKQIEDKQQPIVVNNVLSNVETLLGNTLELIAKISTEVHNSQLTLLTKIGSALELISKSDNKQELMKLVEAINASSIKKELESINTSLNKKEESWQFSITRDNNGNMSSINAKRIN